MKVKTPSSSKISKQATMVASAIPGAMVSDGVVGYIPGGKFGKLGLAILAAFGAASIQGTSTGSDVARGMLAGAAIKQGLDSARELIQPAVNNFVSSGEPNAIKQFVGKTVGLGSPDSFYEGRYSEVHYPETPALGNPYQFNKATQLGVG